MEPGIADDQSKSRTPAAVTFNSVLLNYYRDGNDSVACHSDKENVPGKRPVISTPKHHVIK
jgi:alkylated DNA repair dioxygenase AlkB